MNRTVRTFSCFAPSLSAFLLAACVPVVEINPPLFDEIRYDPTHTLKHNDATREWRTSFSGYRCYGRGKVMGIGHDFKFDDESDELIVTVNDTQGVAPGASYSYTMQQVDNSNVPLQTWYLLTSNPASAPGRQHIFTFPMKISGTSLAWNKAYNIAGSYTFGQSTREAAVDITFHVGNPIQADSFCSPDD